MMYGGKSTVLDNHNNQLRTYLRSIILMCNSSCNNYHILLEIKLHNITQHKHVHIVECVRYMMNIFLCCAFMWKHYSKKTFNENHVHERTIIF